MSTYATYIFPTGRSPRTSGSRLEGALLHGLLIVVALVLITGSPVMAQGSDTHSGRLVKISPDAQSVILEEIVTWTGPDTGLVERTVVLTSDTIVKLVRRTQDADPRGWVGGFRVSPLAPTELKSGDFATVIAEDSGGRFTALSLEIVRPGSP